MRIFAVHGGMEWTSLANFSLVLNQKYVPFLPLPSLQTSPPHHHHPGPSTGMQTIRVTQRHILRLSSWISILVILKNNQNFVEMLTNKYVQLMRFYLKLLLIYFPTWYMISIIPVDTGTKTKKPPWSSLFLTSSIRSLTISYPADLCHFFLLQVQLALMPSSMFLYQLSVATIMLCNHSKIQWLKIIIIYYFL